jgi:hypothetical protein
VTEVGGSCLANLGPGRDRACKGLGNESLAFFLGELDGP